jgi:hypothetical protein
MIGAARRRSFVALVALVALGSGAVGCSPAKTPPKESYPPLETAQLTALSPGPGARWMITARPSALFASTLAAPLSKIVPESGLARLSKLVGFDVKRTPDALFVGYASATLYAAHLPDGTSPGAAVDAFELRILPPSGRASPRPDLVRAWGSTADGARASLVGLWSTKGDAVVGEGGRLGPVTATIALATGKLAPARALSMQAPFVELAKWAEGAEVAMIARCPLSELARDTVKGEPPVVIQECDGAGLTVRPRDGGKVAIAMRVTGRWGKDAEAARNEASAILQQVITSDLGKALGLEDARPIVTSNAGAVDASVELDAMTVAEGLRKLVSADVADLLK